MSKNIQLSLSKMILLLKYGLVYIYAGFLQSFNFKTILNCGGNHDPGYATSNSLSACNSNPENVTKHAQHQRKRKSTFTGTKEKFRISFMSSVS